MKKATPKREKEQLKKLAAMPDAQIDTSDIPESDEFSGGVRHALPGEQTRLIAASRLRTTPISEAPL